MTTRGVKVGDLDKETKDRLGINLSPSVEQASVRYIALGKVLKAIKGLEEEDVLWVLHKAKLQFSQQGEIEQGESNNYVPPISWITQVVARHFGVGVAQLKQRGRIWEVVEARQVVMYLCWSYESYTLNEIGQALGGRKPSTISHGFQNIAQLLSTDNSLKESIEHIQKELSE